MEDTGFDKGILHRNGETGRAKPLRARTLALGGDSLPLASVAVSPHEGGSGLGQCPPLKNAATGYELAVVRWLQAHARRRIKFQGEYPIRRSGGRRSRRIYVA